MATRTMAPTDRFRLEEVSPGVRIDSFHPGGKDGPNSEVLRDFPGGQVWSDAVHLGEASDPFQVTIPDIRLPPNQIWPLHWHDCWVGIVILDGTCMIGDWWMKPGDVLITEASLEYGPLLIGPKGCRMLEVFAQLHTSGGGYSLEYRDHPTLQQAGRPHHFAERSGINLRNAGKSALSIEGVPGFEKGRLDAGSRWDLGAPDDPDRGIMAVTRLGAGETLPAHRYDDWHAMLVVAGDAEIAGRALATDDCVVIRPDSVVDAITAGPDGIKLLEVARTARGSERRPA